jgi:hypothetical protein
LRGIKVGRQWRFRSEAVQQWPAERHEQVLTDLMNGSTYRSIAPRPIQIPDQPQAGADITINDPTGDHVAGTGDLFARVETSLYEIGHAVNDIFGADASVIAPDDFTVPNGAEISQTNTQLVDAACLKGFVPPPPVLLPGPT